ncbi:aminotransferase class I/II-fold pyridoxal phosphate-dependent enzyme, partial [Helicobacter bilis]
MIKLVILIYFFTSNQKSYICNPNNPTGTLHDILKLESLITKYGDMLFVIDEAYYEFCGKSVA